MVGSLLASAYFAFWLFPSIYASRTTVLAIVYFQANESNNTVYWPNLPVFRKDHFSNIEDKNHLYYSACNALPISQQPSCAPSANWLRLDPALLGCGRRTQL